MVSLFAENAFVHLEPPFDKTETYEGKEEISSFVRWYISISKVALSNLRTAEENAVAWKLTVVWERIPQEMYYSVEGTAVATFERRSIAYLAVTTDPETLWLQ